MNTKSLYIVLNKINSLNFDCTGMDRTLGNPLCKTKRESVLYYTLCTIVEKRKIKIVLEHVISRHL
jgi:hypothetical protein